MHLRDLAMQRQQSRAASFPAISKRGKRSKQRNSEAKTRSSLSETRETSLLKTDGDCGSVGTGSKKNAGLDLRWKEVCGTPRQHTFSP